jgi:hypothetical protein
MTLESILFLQYYGTKHVFVIVSDVDFAAPPLSRSCTWKSTPEMINIR